MSKPKLPGLFYLLSSGACVLAITLFQKKDNLASRALKCALQGYSRAQRGTKDIHLTSSGSLSLLGLLSNPSILHRSRSY